MTPADHGYVKCVRCGAWRPRACVTGLGPAAAEGYACSDSVPWCSTQAGVGLGKLDVEAKP